MQLVAGIFHSTFYHFRHRNVEYDLFVQRFFNRKIWIIRFDYSIVLVILFFQSSIVFIKSSLLMNKLKWDVFWLNSLNKKLSFDELNVSNFYGYCTHSPFQLLAVTKRAACCFYLYVGTKWICIRAYSHCMVNNIIYSHSSNLCWRDTITISSSHSSNWWGSVFASLAFSSCELRGTIVIATILHPLPFRASRSRWHSYHLSSSMFDRRDTAKSTYIAL